MRIGWMMAASALVLAGCSQPRQLFVDGAWVRLSAVKGNPAAAYFTLHGGKTDATLINVSTDVAIKAEMHDARMAPVGSVAVPAGQTVAFAPGGRHVMLFDVNPGIKPGRAVTLTFAFADGTRLLQNATTIAAGDPAPQR